MNRFFRRTIALLLTASFVGQSAAPAAALQAPRPVRHGREVLPAFIDQALAISGGEFARPAMFVGETARRAKITSGISRQSWPVGMGMAVMVAVVAASLYASPYAGLHALVNRQDVLASMVPVYSLGVLRLAITSSVHFGRHALVDKLKADPILLPHPDGKQISSLFGTFDVRRMSVDYIEWADDPARPGHRFLAVNPFEYDFMLMHPRWARYQQLFNGIPGHLLSYQFFGNSRVVAYLIGQILPVILTSQLANRLWGIGLAGAVFGFFIAIPLVSLLLIGINKLLARTTDTPVFAATTAMGARGIPWRRIGKFIGRIAGGILLLGVSASAEFFVSGNPSPLVIVLAALMGLVGYSLLNDYHRFEVAYVESPSLRRGAEVAGTIPFCLSAVLMPLLLTGSHLLVMLVAVCMMSSKLTGIYVIGKETTHLWDRFENLRWPIVKTVVGLVIIGAYNSPGQAAISFGLILYIGNLWYSILIRALYDPTLRRSSVPVANEEANLPISEPVGWRMKAFLRSSASLRPKPAVARALASYIVDGYVRRTIGIALTSPNRQEWEFWLNKSGERPVVEGLVVARYKNLSESEKREFVAWVSNHPLRPFRRESNDFRHQVVPLLSALWRDWNPRHEEPRTAEENVFGVWMNSLNPKVPAPVSAPQFGRSTELVSMNAQAAAKSHFPQFDPSSFDFAVAAVACLAENPRTFSEPTAVAAHPHANPKAGSDRRALGGSS